MDEIKKTLEAHEQLRFPAGYRSRKVEGVSITVLDSEARACAYSYLTSGGRLGPNKRLLVKQCFERAQQVLKEEHPEEAMAFFNSLARLTQLIQKSLPPEEN